MRYPTLPVPDQYGSYWLGRRATTELGPAEPAIFPSKKAVPNPDNPDVPNVIRTGTFIVSMGEDGFLFDGPDFVRFETPEAALAEINRRLGIPVTVEYGGRLCAV